MVCSNLADTELMAGCQNLRYTILDLDSFDILQEGRIPLPKKVQLSWVGFTAEGVSSFLTIYSRLTDGRYRRSTILRVCFPCWTGIAAQVKRAGYLSSIPPLWRGARASRRTTGL